MWLAILMTRLSVRLGDSGSTGFGTVGVKALVPDCSFQLSVVLAWVSGFMFW